MNEQFSPEVRKAGPIVPQDIANMALMIQKLTEINDELSGMLVQRDEQIRAQTGAFMALKEAYQKLTDKDLPIAAQGNVTDGEIKAS